MITLYEHRERRVFYADWGTSRKYKHYFGGQLQDFGFRLLDPSRPLHLVCSFDKGDPSCPIECPAPRIPLCYGFRFGGKAIAYRLDDDLIDLLLPQNPQIYPDFPCENYPASYPLRELVLRECGYDATDTETALMNSAMFGLSHLTDKTLTKVAKRLNEFGYWDDEDLQGQTRNQHLRTHRPSLPLMQGIPDSRCVYPECPAFQLPEAMKIIALHSGDQFEGTELWGSSGETVELIFQMCVTCQTICVSNQCT